ncbi:protein phosphatase 2C domain-containing protein [Streptomyces sp. XD-27]|uniref:protein phosphatase 2C domain-containing protein n=1 Tax=Streptomyces sp. XD-27 TaxID=3062779 RepID=UPI0026F438D7|nr:protein phosphatase 2C domain-containing protein [Streptomyces sp. XD-27]WKX73136.1 protein phosphatase 2C domain-containing protein [Streptomyces sp. XD-27]
MSQQGERRGHEDDWWRELYDADSGDTGPATAGDSLDDRFATASLAVGSPPGRAASVGTVALETAPAAVPGPDTVTETGAEAGGEAGTEVARHVGFVGSRPPTYDPEPTALPLADPADLADLVPDTVLDGARHGALTLRAASLRGDSARYRGQPRRDALLTARFGAGRQALVLVAVATGPRAVDGAHRAAREVCEGIGAAVGRSHARLAADIHGGRRAALKSGLHRLTARSLGRLRARACELHLDPAEYTASLRCLLLPGDPACRTRVFFGVGDGGLFRLRDGVWQDLEPTAHETDTVGGTVVGRDPATGDTGSANGSDAESGPDAPGGTGPTGADPAPHPHAASFRFRASVGRPGDTLLLCSAGLADPLRDEPALAERLRERWAVAEPPGLAAFLADTQLRVTGYADDRTAAAVWEA